MTKDEALKLALEALEEAADAIDSWGSYASGYFQVKHDLESDISKAKSAITAIKEALAQPEQEPVGWAEHGVINWLADKQFNHTSFLYATPSQRTWVGLTDEDDLDWGEGGSLKDLVKAIENKLKAKNT